MNLMRLARWLNCEKPAQPRRTPFTRLFTTSYALLRVRQQYHDCGSTLNFKQRRISNERNPNTILSEAPIHKYHVNTCFL